MIGLLSVAIVAGLISESSQQTAAPCVYPTHIQCWTPWFNRDHPSATGDWELLSDLRKVNPGAVCPDPLDIEATTLTGASVGSTGETIHLYNKNQGFVCKNANQAHGMCSDYRVRYSCPPQYCAGVCWTKWFDRDNPSGTGDWELYQNATEHIYPIFIEAAVLATGAPAISTGQVFHVYNPHTGFVCRNVDQPGGRCLDYKVRFGCQCS